MLDNGKKRCSGFEKQRYNHLVKVHFSYYGFEILERMYRGSLDMCEISEHGAGDTLKYNYPVAPWIERYNIIEQFVAMFEEMGYSFTYNEQGKYSFKDADIYGDIVRNHLKVSGGCIPEVLRIYCDRYGGRIMYYDVEHILGKEYPKPPFVNKSDTKACILFFLKETGINFKFDDTYLYFP